MQQAQLIPNPLRRRQRHGRRACVAPSAEHEGKTNLAEENGGNWEWRSIAIFGVIAILLGVGGTVIWRRRAVS